MKWVENTAVKTLIHVLFTQVQHWQPRLQHYSWSRPWHID